MPLDDYRRAAEDGLVNQFYASDSPNPPNRKRSRVRLGQPWQWIDPEKIPRREWLYGRYLQRGIVSVTVAPGGVGKSSLSIVEALALASGRRLHGAFMPDEPLRAWYWNLEDPQDELNRRIAAACKHFKISAADLADSDATPLYINSGLETPLMTASEMQKGIIIEPAFEDILNVIRAEAIDALIIDPFVSSHDLSENDNMRIDRVVKRWSRLATAANVAISLVHHTRKAVPGQPMTEESARGAKALVDAARVVRVLQPMSEEEAQAAGLPEGEHRRFFRAGREKQNLAPPDTCKDWFRIESVSLGNGETPDDPGDSVGVVTPWQWPDLFEGIEADQLRTIQLAAKSQSWGANPQASDWLGNEVAAHLDMCAKTYRRRICKMIDHWIAVGAFEQFEEHDTRRGRSRPMLKVGTINPASTPPEKSGVDRCDSEDD